MTEVNPIVCPSTPRPLPIWRRILKSTAWFALIVAIVVIVMILLAR
jgi:hypothetical protein